MKINTDDAAGSFAEKVQSIHLVFKAQETNIRTQRYFAETIGMEIELILDKVLKMFDNGNCNEFGTYR